MGEKREEGGGSGRLAVSQEKEEEKEDKGERLWMSGRKWQWFFKSWIFFHGRIGSCVERELPCRNSRLSDFSV